MRHFKGFWKARTPLGGTLAVLSGLATIAFAPAARADNHPNGAACAADADCTSGICTGGVCEPLALSDVAEIQFDTSSPALNALIDTAAQSLVNEQVCGLPTVPCLASSGQCVIDSVATPVFGSGSGLTLQLGPTATFAAVDGPVPFNPVQAVLPVTVTLLNQACFTDPAGPCPPPESHTVSFFFNLAPVVDATGDVQLCTALAGTNLAVVTAGLPQSAFASHCTSLSQFSAVEGVLGANVNTVLLSANQVGGSAGTRLSVRLLFTVPGDNSIASNDLFRADSVGPYLAQGLIAPFPPGSDWSVFIGGTLMSALAQEKAFNELQTNLAAQVALTQDPPADPWTSAWVASGPTSQFGISAAGSYLDCELVAGAEANATFALDTLVHQISVQGQVDVSLAHPGLCWADIFVPGVDTTLFTILENASFGQFSAALFPGAACSLGGTLGHADYACVFPSVAPPFSPFVGAPSLTAEATRLFGVESGLVVGGTLTASTLATPPQVPTTATTTGSFTLAWDGSCSIQGLTWQGSIDVEGTGQLCGVSMSPAVAAQYQVIDPAPQNPTLPKTLEVVSLLGPDAPLPFSAEVRTTDGAANVTLALPQGLSAIQILALRGQIANQCNQIESGWLGQPGVYDPTWAPYPAPEDPAAIFTFPSGATALGTVTLANVKFQSVGPVARTADVVARGGLELHKHALRMTATAVVRASRDLPAFTVPITHDFLVDLTGSTVPSVGPGFVELTALEALSARFQIPASALPRNLAGASFTIDIAPGAMTLLGYVPQDDLLASFNLDETSGSVVSDDSGNGNDGRLVGSPPPAFTGGYSGGGLAFTTRAFNEVDVADAPSLNPATQLSLSAWFNTADGAPSINGSESIVGKDRDGAKQYELRIQAPQGVLLFVVNNAMVGGRTKITPNTWHHVVATYDGVTMRIYLDGQLDASRAVATTMSDNGQMLRIGQWPGSYAFPFNGTLDEVRVYGTALTPAQAALPYW